MPTKSYAEIVEKIRQKKIAWDQAGELLQAVAGETPAFRVFMDMMNDIEVLLSVVDNQATELTRLRDSVLEQAA